MSKSFGWARIALACAALAVAGMPVLAAEKEYNDTALLWQVRNNEQRYGIEGQAVLIIHNGKVLFRQADGYADRPTHRPVMTDTIFETFSVAKLFASTLVMQLVDEGTVELDKPAVLYVTGLPKTWHAITVRQLLNHTSGLPEYFEEGKGQVPFPESPAAMYTALADKPLRFPPGSDVRYTQTNYVVIAQLIAEHYGKPYAQVVDERIIGKLKLTNTSLGAPLPRRQGVATQFIGKDGKLEKDPGITFPAYGYGHAGMFSTIDDLGTFLKAMAAGEMVRKETLEKLWREDTLSNGRTGWFATGWESGQSDGYRYVGHDGGTKVRVRIAWKGSLDGDTYIVVYLTNGSRRNVWSRVLVDSMLGTVSPGDFPAEALSNRLIDEATARYANPVVGTAKSIRESTPLQGKDLERQVNTTGYTVRENLGVEAALRVFELNTVLFPASANTWDSLAETWAAKGDQQKAKMYYDKSRELAKKAGK
ncbi:CubicO group peptidase (beta-lactamase class C family) [Luteibacter sp. Sphag1AF]|uniref:serine hydrolase domain-containing protein n=1 Tax=Luteibacter sp. Sphag1AF TaxID=2587031 RepID=UPI0016192FB4|nr:serine hydrolase domain-containing protein [Luteibacter sp. Sphag1AF]MBB3228102.1 CubicO group peptidase (beta-lactamase class C family) [Luteibacter sp. Sphag1AF]